MSVISDCQAARLKAIASVQDKLAAGSVKLLGLDDIRAHFGEGWAEIKAKVFRHAQIAIDKTIDERDVSIRVGEEGFLFVFANPDPKHAEEQSAAVADAIRRRLFGEDACLASRIDTAVRSFCFEHESLASILTDTSGLFASAHKRPATEESKRGESADKDKNDTRSLSIAFRPVWDVAKSAVIEFAAKPWTSGDNSACAQYFGAAETPESRRKALESDLRTVSAVGNEFMRLAQANRRLLITACVSASSFSTLAFQTKMISAIREIPREPRNLFQCIVYETRLGTHARDVETALRCLGPWCRSVGFSTSIDNKDLQRVRLIGVKTVGVDLGPYCHIPEQAIMTKLNVFARSAKEAGLNLSVGGVNSRSMSSFAVCCGASQISGQVIGPCVERISPAARYAPFDLYRGMTERQF